MQQECYSLNTRKNRRAQESGARGCEASLTAAERGMAAKTAARQASMTWGAARKERRVCATETGLLRAPRLKT